MPGIQNQLIALLSGGECVALATLIARRGSAPGSLGMKMLVREDGTSVGTIGGGCVEADVWQAAMTAQKTGRAEVLSFRLNLKDAAESGLICGGTIEVLVEPLQPDDLSAYDQLLATEQRGATAVMATRLPTGAEDSRKPQKLVAAADRPFDPSFPEPLREIVLQRLQSADPPPAEIVEVESGEGEERWLLEASTRPVTLIVLGAGHLSRDIVPLANRVHFRTVVVDDRPMFANREGFPDADEVVVAEFDEVLERFLVGPRTFVLIVTRGHLHDELLLEQALRTEAGYIGMIGSRTKIRTIYARLRKRGVSEEGLARVHAPVGLAIGARLPEEIAVSIVAELIQKRSAG